MNRPKKYIRQFDLVPQKQGPQRRQELLDNIANNGTYLPRGVEIEDMDKAFLESVKTDMEIVIEGENVPVFLLNSQRWAEFTKTYDFTNEFKSLKIPFISVVRRPDIQPGTNQAGMWNIPQGKKTYTYMKVPTWDGNQKGMDIYKIPQPTSVDLTYEVRLFCDRMSELNKLHKVIQLLFQSRQHYISVKGHPMPIHLESVSDESTMNDFENRRFYVQSFEMTLLGYLLNEDDMEVKPAIKRSVLVTELSETKNEKKINYNIDKNNIFYNIKVLDAGMTLINLKLLYDVEFVELNDVVAFDSVSLFKNGEPVGLPFKANNGDTVSLNVDNGVSNDGHVILRGVIQ